MQGRHRRRRSSVYENAVEGKAGACEYNENRSQFLHDSLALVAGSLWPLRLFDWRLGARSLRDAVDRRPKMRVLEYG